MAFHPPICTPILSNTVVDVTIANVGILPEPIDITTAKKWLKMESISDDDDLITDLIVQARSWLEQYTGMLLIQRQVVAQLEIKNRLEFPWGPVELSGLIITQNGQTVAAPKLTGLDGGFMGLIGYGIYDVEYMGGYTIVPSSLILALKQYISYAYEHRGDGLEESTKEYAYEAKRTAFPYRRNIGF